jgi:NADH-quinone oxidoreductase subunit G
MHEPKATIDEESALAFSMEGVNNGENGALIPYVWAPGWNSNQAVTRFQLEVGGRLRGGDPGTRLVQPNANGWPEGHADLPADTPRDGFTLLPVHEISAATNFPDSPPIRERMAALCRAEPRRCRAARRCRR